jgi:hypothetical protein
MEEIDETTKRLPHPTKGSNLVAIFQACELNKYGRNFLGYKPEVEVVDYNI